MTYPHERKSPSRTWTRADIRRARQTPLPPVLEALGYELAPLPNGNHGVRRPIADTCPGGASQSPIIVKDHYWVNTADGAAGNAIDFLVDVQGMTFSQAMATLCPDTGRPGAS